MCQQHMKRWCNNVDWSLESVLLNINIIEIEGVYLILKTIGCISARIAFKIGCYKILTNQEVQYIEYFNDVIRKGIYLFYMKRWCNNKKS